MVIKFQIKQGSQSPCIQKKIGLKKATIKCIKRLKNLKNICKIFFYKNTIFIQNKSVFLDQFNAFIIKI